MDERSTETVISSLLHDTGKVIYREGTDRRKHSISGYEFLKSELGINNKNILEGVKYHHADAIKGSNIDDNSIAYIVCIADNIASATDRRDKMEEEQGFEISTPLESVFNRLNKNSEHNRQLYYRPDMLNIEKEINYPVSEKKSFDKIYYKEVKQNLINNLKGVTQYDNKYINSLLEVLEANLTYVPCATSKREVQDISLYDHVKITAAIALCIYQYLDENGIDNYKKELFTGSKKFYEKEAFILYSMDISGIQEFIYTINSKNAMKMLRSKSSYLEIMMEHIIDCLLDRLELARTNLIYSGGGHCYILLPNTNKAKNIIKEYNEEVNEWLLKNFQTSLYVSDGYSICSSNDFQNKPNGSYANIFKNISRMISKKKASRYSAKQLMSLNNSKIKDTTRECCVCRRIGKLNDEEMCSVCAALKDMSSKILDDNYEFFTILSQPEKNSLILPLGYYLVADTKASLVERLKKSDNKFVRAYCKNKMYTSVGMVTKLWVGNYHSDCNTFEDMAKASRGIERIGVLRADVDNLGTTFVSGFNNKENDNRYVTLSRTATLSRLLSLFFKMYINSILQNGEYCIDGNDNDKKKYIRNAVICYSGGDDVFIVGAWNEVIELAVDLKQKFEMYTENTLTISAGIGVYQHDYPISVIANEVAELENMSKNKAGKNAITLFDDGAVHNEYDSEGYQVVISDGTYSWDEFINEVIGEKYKCIKEFFDNEDERGMGFLYNLLELIRNQEDRINFASIYTNLEPDKEALPALPEVRQRYNIFSQNMYKWVRLDKADSNKLTKDGRQLKTAMNIYSYIRRNNDKND